VQLERQLNFVIKLMKFVENSIEFTNKLQNLINILKI